MGFCYPILLSFLSSSAMNETPTGIRPFNFSFLNTTEIKPQGNIKEQSCTKRLPPSGMVVPEVAGLVSP
jgi:hypothetical protein